MGLHTDFAPPTKNSAEEIKKQVEYFIEDGIFSNFYIRLTNLKIIEYYKTRKNEEILFI